MKVLLYGNFWHASMEKSYMDALKEMGVEVACFDPQPRQATLHASSRLSLSGRLVRKFRTVWFKGLVQKNINRTFIQKAAQEHPDLILVFKGIELIPQTLQTIKEKISSPIAIYHPDNLFLDSSSGWNENILKSLSCYDFHLTYGKFLIPELIRYGATNAHHLPCAYNPSYGLNSPKDMEKVDEFRCDIAFAGTWDPEREQWLSLLAQKFKVSIWGNEWENCRNPALLANWKQRALYGRDFALLCQTATFCFNFVRTANNQDSHNMRTFEIPAFGGVALSNRTQEQMEFFKDGEEMIFFDSKEELMERTAALISHPEKIAEIRKRARTAAAPWTYTERARQILQTATRLKSGLPSKP